METVHLKRAPAPPGVAVTQTGRFGFLGQALLQNQQRNLAMFNERPLSLREAATALNVGHHTLRNWVHQGLIHAIRIGSKGHFKFKPSEIRRVLGEQNG
jgi:excisionase family DNA binding protein